MKISRIAGYIGAGLLTASCSMKPASQKALEHASKYLTGSELFAAECRAETITANNTMNYSQAIHYWDSLLSVNREKEFFKKGQEHIQDSVNGKYKRKLPTHINIKPDVSQNEKTIVDSIKTEVAKYYSGSEMLNLERKAPQHYSGKYGTRDNYITHYYGTLAIKGAERKGFNDGMISERKKLGIE